MMSHQEAAELLAVFALDALEGDEHELIEAHLAECPRCRAELDAHREVAAALGNSVEPLPEGLWSSIAGALPPHRDQEPPPMPTLVRDRARRSERPRRPIRHARPGAPAGLARSPVLGGVPRGRRGGGRRRLGSESGRREQPGGSVARCDRGDRAYCGRGRTRDAGPQGGQSEDVRAVNSWRSSSSYRVVRATLSARRLPELSSKETYQLWGVVNGQTISIGVLGRSPHLVTFTLAGSPEESRLGITAETAGGSILPSQAMLASGTV